MSKSKRMFARWAAVAALILVSGSRAHAQTTITIGNASGPAGGTATVDVMLNSDQAIAGTQNNIAFDPKAAIAAKPNTKPDCTVNDAINKGGTSFAFQAGNTQVKALVLALDNVCPICGPTTDPTCGTPPACPVVMYTCKVNIATDASGSFPLTCSAAGASDPAGHAVAATCTDGSVSVGEVATPTDTVSAGPTPTPTPVVTEGATNTATATVSGVITSPTATSTSVVTPTGGTQIATPTVTGGTRVATPTITGGTQVATPTITGTRPATATVTGSQAATPTITGTRPATPTVTRTGQAGTPTRRPVRPTDDDACAIVSPATSASGWMLLLPAAALLWIRRRSR